MIFATYQSIETLEEISEDKLSRSLWAVPMTELRDSFVSLFCCAPNRMEVLIFLESERYRRIDKVAWYRAIEENEENGKTDPVPCFSEDADDLHSEFLLDGVTADDVRLIVPIAEIGESADIIDRERIEMDPTVLLYLKGLADRVMSKFFISPEQNMAFGVDRSYAEYRCALQPKKIAFETVYFPIVFYLFKIKEDGVKGDVRFLANMISLNVGKLMRLSNRFTEWSYGDCDPEGFDAVTSEIKQCVIEDKNVVLRLVNGPKIERNEPCPCGSGKKFKKCHGFFIM